MARPTPGGLIKFTQKSRELGLVPESNRHGSRGTWYPRVISSDGSVQVFSSLPRHRFVSRVPHQIRYRGNGSFGFLKRLVLAICDGSIQVLPRHQLFHFVSLQVGHELLCNSRHVVRHGK